jgi:hypothetical protein
MRVSVDEYVDAVSEGAMFRCAMLSKVKESGQQFAALESFRLRLPDLTVQVGFTLRNSTEVKKPKNIN